MINKREIVLGKVNEPVLFSNVAPTLLTDETIVERKSKLLAVMKKKDSRHWSFMPIKNMAVILNI